MDEDQPRPRPAPGGASGYDVVRIANCSGFFGDRMSAPREMVEGGPIDFLTGDYLAELTMLILWKNRQRDAQRGYATTFVRQMEEVLGSCLDRGIKIVVNAGGLNPAGLAERLEDLSRQLGLSPRIAHVDGGDLRERVPELLSEGHQLAHLDTGQPFAELGIEPVTANAYIGAWGIVAALERGADVVICPRTSDASLVVGPAAWAFGWQTDDWDAIAGAVAAGHVIECGAQATGGNYSFFTEIDDLLHPGFPIAELGPDGSSVITKHEGTGGAVTVGTVTEQLIYEIATERYLNPDVVARFGDIRLDQVGQDRVRLSGVRGESAPTCLKLSMNYFGGYRQALTFHLTGPKVEQKAAIAEAGLFEALGGRDSFEHVETRLVRSDRADAKVNADAVARLEVTLKDRDEEKLGRRVFDAMISLTLASYPGFYTDLNRTASTYGVNWPTLIPASEVSQRVVFSDGESVAASCPPRRDVEPTSPADAPPSREQVDWGETTTVPLGSVYGARSGDKAGNANVGIWARSDRAYAWLATELTVARLRDLLPEADGLEITRSELPGLRAVNFVVRGLLDEGVAATSRPDPQAKGLGEFIRSRPIDLPRELVAAAKTTLS